MSKAREEYKYTDNYAYGFEEGKVAGYNQGIADTRQETRLNTLEEIQSKMISLHTNMIFEYGVDIIEARADAFGELKDWLKEQIEMYGE